jgi:hypothetical protein
MSVSAELPEIVDALYRFGAGQDLDDRALFDSAFTQDATLDFSHPASRFGVTLPPFEGREGIGDAVFAAIGALDTTHTVTNPRATVDGDKAELIALVEAQHVRADRHLLLKNIYRVGLVRDGDQWRMQRVQIELVWHDGDPEVLLAA